MEVSYLKKLANKVFKTLKSLNVDFMHIYFKKVHILLGEKIT